MENSGTTISTKDITVSNYCTIPECNHPLENYELGLCSTHNKVRRTKPKEEKKKVKVKPVGDKMKEQLAIYTRLKKVWIVGKMCGVSGCQVAALDVHHMKGRTGLLLLDTTYWLPVCRDCHFKIESYPAWAKQEGYSVERLAI